MPSSNVVIYARYSSDNQREESIEGQLRECRAYEMCIRDRYNDRMIGFLSDFSAYLETILIGQIDV